MLIATDLDRTLLPNGAEPDDGSLRLFYKIIHEQKYTLAYVSGRNLDLFQEARGKYSLELPDYYLGDVGTSLYIKQGETLQADKKWQEYLLTATPNWDIEKMRGKIDFPGLSLQEDSKQTAHKLSYYVDLSANQQGAIKHIEMLIKDLKIRAHVVYSIDPLAKIGLLDILPTSATKVAGLEFLRERLGIPKGELMYCGDSGNDILPLTNGYLAVMVKNTHPDTKAEVIRRNQTPDLTEKTFIARGQSDLGLNGNYASGIIEGMIHFGLISTTEVGQS
ncbi:MAG: HAD-IIB family hydrolase [Patescibacteria group bacterium]|nr:HAD-IIB family hydrolase [Patescibacteria group bacterium]